MAVDGYLKGLVFVFCAGIFWSTQGLAVRLIEAADAWQILFYRSLALSAFLAAAIFLRNGKRTLSAIQGTGAGGLLGGLSLVFAYAAGIIAMQQTSIASAVLLFATAPFFAAILGLVLLSEHVRRTTWITMIVALGGIIVMQGGTFSGGQMVGNLFAMGSAFGFAVFTIVLRWKKQNDMLPTVFLSGIFSVIICTVIIFANGSGLRISNADMGIALLMGVFQTGAGLILYTVGARAVPAVQLTLLPLIEIVLSPVWVALFIKEYPSSTVLVGGAVVVVSVLADALLGTKKAKSPSGN
ncbi:DMT family transporter [Nereida ignava]|uniref:DMT family transporter n=1 Tax=Nereida ignava TaxID=282199 RepID=UPI002FDF1450